jgi:hypothetical protein
MLPRPSSLLTASRPYDSIALSYAIDLYQQQHWWHISSGVHRTGMGFMPPCHFAICAVVPLGYHLDSEGLLALCPKGTYRSDVSAKHCTPCGEGITMPDAGSTSKWDCRRKYRQ